jgi:DNA-binding MarR family transcriptional regulator
MISMNIKEKHTLIYKAYMNGAKVSYLQQRFNYTRSNIYMIIYKTQAQNRLIIHNNDLKEMNLR